MSTSTDAALMRRVRDGDRDAFAVLVDRYKHKLINYLTMLTRNRDRSEELAQDAFVRLYVHASAYEERGQFAPYLYRIATNLLRTEQRKQRRRELLLQLFSRNGASSNGHDAGPQEGLLRKELEKHVGDAIAALPMRYRSPLLLREMEGWSYRDIAAALSCREGTVKSRVHRGRTQLRELLTPYWNGGRA